MATKELEFIGKLYDMLCDTCEEAKGDIVPRCYGCRREQDGHCAAAKLGCCLIWKTLEEARKYLENKEFSNADFGTEEK